jgi:hypothetical protein
MTEKRRDPTEDIMEAIERLGDAFRHAGLERPVAITLATEEEAQRLSCCVAMLNQPLYLDRQGTRLKGGAGLQICGMDILFQNRRSTALEEILRQGRDARARPIR